MGEYERIGINGRMVRDTQIHGRRGGWGGKGGRRMLRNTLIDTLAGDRYLAKLPTHEVF